MEKYIITENEKGKRLDAYIATKNENITRTSAQRMIEEGNILVNGKKQKVAYKINIDDVVTVVPEAVAFATASLIALLAVT